MDSQHMVFSELRRDFEADNRIQKWLTTLVCLDEPVPLLRHSNGPTLKTHHRLVVGYNDDDSAHYRCFKNGVQVA
ncbi:hypothetical protein [Vibrio marinisediminis]|uniref:hypothetical protein n=1 Tax=Vibrio marinisediminis TaxID=2758441 RepID=UPI001FE33D4B|nr:hypothetical protein [Vibrio marinisediminis]